jgi:cytochrome P450
MLRDCAERWIQHYYPVLDKINTFFKPKSTPLAHNFVLSRSQQRNPDAASLLHKLQSKSADITTMLTAAESMDHMAAGIDTTGDGLCFLMYELSLPHNTHRMQRLQREITDNSAAKLDELPYLDAVIKEGLRLFPPIPMSFPRYVPRGGRQILNYTLPGGTIVSCQPYSLHLLNTDVFPNPETFLPERWLDKEGDIERNRLFFSFSSGGRGCIGKNLALVEMKVLLREIYGRFTTTVAKEMTADMSIDDQIIASRPRDQTCKLVFVDRTDI